MRSKSTQLLHATSPIAWSRIQSCWQTALKPMPRYYTDTKQIRIKTNIRQTAPIDIWRNGVKFRFTCMPISDHKTLFCMKYCLFFRTIDSYNRHIIARPWWKVFMSVLYLWNRQAVSNIVSPTAILVVGISMPIYVRPFPKWCLLMQRAASTPDLSEKKNSDRSVVAVAQSELSFYCSL